MSQILPDSPGTASGIESVDGTQANLPTGGTPMAERVAVIGLLNKRNGVSRDLTLKPGQAVRVGDVVVRLRACEKTASWEPEQLTGAFVQVDVRGANQRWQRVFSGWLYKERPALNVVLHPVYDVWTKSCTMSWPETGPDTVPASLPGPAPKRSSAAKSPEADTPAADAPARPRPPMRRTTARHNPRARSRSRPWSIDDWSGTGSRAGCIPGPQSCDQPDQRDLGRIGTAADHRLAEKARPSARP